MNKKSKEIVKKLCFTLVVVISIISIIGCPNTVSSKANGTSSSGGSTGGGDDPKPDPVKDTIEAMKIKGNDDPIVHSKDGLSFGWRENKLCLLSTEDHYPAGSNDPNYPLNEAFKKIKDEIGDEGVAFIPTSFDSVSDGLEKRWIAARKTKRKEGGKWLLFSSRSTSELDGYLTSGLDLPNGSLKNVGFFEFNNISQRFAVDKNKDIIVFITDDLTTHFADWHLVFVERVEDLNPDKIPEMYSFHYGPYTLKNKRNEDPDLHVPNYESCSLHVFTLSEMLKDCLKKEGKEAIADQVVAEFPPLLPKNKDKYDVYLVIGKVFSYGATMFGYERVKYSFRNILKLSDYAYWKDCWEKDESVKTTSP